MELDIREIEEIYRKRISLFKELLNCVVLERDNLINQDIEGIWATVEEKNKILKSIEENRGHILRIAGKVPTYMDIQQNERSSFTELSRTLNDLREEIRVRVAENISFIGETLQFFHDIFMTITMAGRDEKSYGPFRNGHKESNLIFHSEV